MGGGPTITSIMSSDDDTTIEINRFRKGSDMVWYNMLQVPMVEGQGVGRLFKMLVNTIRHPRKGDSPLGVYFPSAQKVAKAFAAKLNGEPGNSLLERSLRNH